MPGQNLNQLCRAARTERMSTIRIPSQKPTLAWTPLSAIFCHPQDRILRWHLDRGRSIIFSCNGNSKCCSTIAYPTCKCRICKWTSDLNFHPIWSQRNTPSWRLMRNRSKTPCRRTSRSTSKPLMAAKCIAGRLRTVWTLISFIIFYHSKSRSHPLSMSTRKVHSSPTAKLSDSR